MHDGDGAVSNSGVTNVTGDIGSNNGSATGYDSLLVIARSFNQAN
jgi:hypothetical protein